MGFIPIVITGSDSEIGRILLPLLHQRYRPATADTLKELAARLPLGLYEHKALLHLPRTEAGPDGSQTMNLELVEADLQAAADSGVKRVVVVTPLAGDDAVEKACDDFATKNSSLQVVVLRMGQMVEADWKLADSPAAATWLSQSDALRVVEHALTGPAGGSSVVTAVSAKAPPDATALVRPPQPAQPPASRVAGPSQAIVR